LRLRPKGTSDYSWLMRTLSNFSAQTALMAACFLAACNRAHTPPHAEVISELPAPIVAARQPEPPAVGVAVAATPATITPIPKSTGIAPVEPVVPTSPRAVAAGIIDFAETTLASDAWKPLGEYRYLSTSMGYVRHHAGDVVATDEGDLAALSARSAALLNALEDAASTAQGIALRPRTTQPNKQALAQLETELRAKATTLAAVILPLPAANSIKVASPERRAAVAALILAQTARADETFLRPGGHPTMSAGIETLERAAQSVLFGNDENKSVADARLSALSTAIQGAARVAAGIDRRANESPQNRSKAAELATSLRTVGGQLSLAMQSSPQDVAIIE
jgi:hypothetical protein